MLSYEEALDYLYSFVDYGSVRADKYSPETFDGLMRLRGVECGVAEGYAEAFHARKVVFRV